MTNEVDAKGYYVLEKHCRVHFRFHDTRELQLEGFVPNNILFSLSITKDENQSDWSVLGEVVCDGIDLKFTCAQLEVVSLTPRDSQGQPL